MTWINIKDELPNTGEYVDIATCSFGRNTRRFDFKYEGNGVFYNNNYDKTYTTEAGYNQVTYFIRVPEPPNAD